jgi:hypothetical protein
MSDFRDPFPNLPQVVDIGNDRYFMGAQKPIELGFKDRADYIKSFSDNSRTEFLIRKYLYISLKGKKRLVFEDPKEKAELIAILQKRAKKIESSNEFTSSTLKNTLLQRSYLNIQRLIQELEGPDYKGFKFPSLPDISLPCTKAKKYIRTIPENRLYQLILEIAWYLLHPDDVPEKVKCDWAKTIKQLDTLRIGDLVINEKQNGNNVSPSNYFKRINLSSVVKSKTLVNALDQAREMAQQIEGTTANDNMKERLQTLINILEIKKYLSDDLPVDKDRVKIIDVPAATSISNSLISNPMKGGAGAGAGAGAGKALDKPLGIAMRPLFNYFKVVFDPVYSLLESSIDTYSKKTDIQKVMIPQLTTVLHICNNLNPSETTTSGLNTYGVYRIKNVDETLITFMNNMIASTDTYVSSVGDDAKRNIFNRQLFHLPKVRLSSLLNKFVDPTKYSDPDSIPYIQLFTVGGNLRLIEKDKFMNSTKPEMTEEVFKAVNEFFAPTDLYILCTKSDNVKENIPMNMYEIDYDNVDVGETGIQIDNISNNYFNKNKKPELYLENLVTLLPYVVFNDAELALSILILFKELMPK